VLRWVITSLPFLFFPAFASAQQDQVNDPVIRFVRNPDPAPDFKLTALDGKPLTLAALQGKVVLLNFWATWCGPCRLEMPELDTLYTHFQSQGLVVLSITDEDPFKVNSFIAPNGYHPPVLIDSKGEVHKQFHIEGIPRTFVINRDGKLVAEAIDQRTMRQFLVMLSKTDLHP
jgi:peroxiredoxin